MIKIPRLAQICAAALVLFAVLVAPRSVGAQTVTPPPTPSDDDVNRIAQKLYCPVCENIPLDTCSTQACAQWRATIREKLAAGWSEQRILDYFVQQYGERVLAQPRAQGFTALLWWLPPVILVIGGVVLGVFLRQRLAARVPAEAAAPAPEAPPADEYVARLEKELRKRR